MFTLKNFIKHSKLTLNLVMQADFPVKCIKRSFFNKQDLRKIFLKSLEAVDTKKLVRDQVKIVEDKLTICGRNYTLKNKIYLVGFGKAVFNMAIEMEAILGTNLRRGVVAIPTGTLSSGTHRKMAAKSNITFIEAAKDNYPDLKSIFAAEEISKLAKSLQKNDLLIVLISGGGSALLSLPIHPISLNEKCDIVKKLSKNGATIFELNTVRKRLSQLKGGGLAKIAYPAYVVSLILSDVIGDPLDFIASGPTVLNKDNPTDAYEILKKYNLLNDVSKDVIKILKGPIKEDDIPLNPLGNYFHVENNLIGSNTLLVEAAKKDAVRRGYEAIIISNKIEGDVYNLAKIYAELSVDLGELLINHSTKTFLKLKYEEEAILNLKNIIDKILGLNFENKRGICLIGGGEPTVFVPSKGKGGRNQHLALQFSKDVHEKLSKNNFGDLINISFLSCGSDGIDGPTDAAGAVGTSCLYKLAEEHELEPDRFLRNCDSYSFFESFMGGEYMVKTGHTGTNVMDLHLLIISKNFENNEFLKIDLLKGVPQEKCKY